MVLFIPFDNPTFIQKWLFERIGLRMCKNAKILIVPPPKIVSILWGDKPKTQRTTKKARSNESIFKEQPKRNPNELESAC